MKLAGANVDGAGANGARARGARPDRAGARGARAGVAGPGTRPESPYVAGSRPGAETS